MLFTNRINRNGIKNLKLFGEEIKSSSDAKFLGVTFDSKLRFEKHLNDRCNKAMVIFNQCRKAFGRTWGLKPKYIYWIYNMVILPMLFYGGKELKL